MTETETNAPPAALQRQVGLGGAILLGLGSILGTGVFVSLAMATGLAGPSVILAIVLAAGVAMCNGLSSAQLAANHPVSGGTYEYGYHYLNPQLGFTAGWMFLCAKSASAATAALGLAGYLLHLANHNSTTWVIPLALAMVLGVTTCVLMGIRRTNRVNFVLVSLTLFTLAAFVVTGLPLALKQGSETLSPFFAADTARPFGLSFFEATALVFVAYTGYGRVATLGEEIKDPRKNIPIAVILTLSVSMVLYVSVAAVAVAAVGTEKVSEAASGTVAPLEAISAEFSFSQIGLLVAMGGVMAMLGVLLNLVLGLSRVALAMGRRHDLPHGLATLNASGTNPTHAVIFVAVFISGLVFLGDVKTTWSFSAFTVLIYYALTNLAALKLTAEERLFSKLFSLVGLLCCLALAFFVQPAIWMIGLGLILIGLLWQQGIQRFYRSQSSSKD